MADAPLRTNRTGQFVATSPAMLDVLERVDAYARARTPILIVGATGTGKTTVAELVHSLSGRSGPLVAQTVGELDQSLERSQLFGHERGSFSGAVSQHVGLLEEAAQGTLLLDDFHHIGPSTQLMLLRALDRDVFRRVGGDRDLPVTCRVIVGLTDKPDQLVHAGPLLPELRFRLGYSTIHLPSLDERRGDIPELALRFLRRCPEETGESGPQRLASEVVSVLQLAQWPGNLRQLAMTIRDAYLRARSTGVIRLRHLSDLIALPLRFRKRAATEANFAAIRLALEATHGHVRDAAALLRTSRTTVYQYLARAGSGNSHVIRRGIDDPRQQSGSGATGS